MDDDTIRNGTGSRAVNGHAPEARVDGIAPAAPAGRPVTPVPPMEAEWLRAVGGRPDKAEGDRPTTDPWNGHTDGGVDSTRGGH